MMDKERIKEIANKHLLGENSLMFNAGDLCVVMEEALTEFKAEVTDMIEELNLESVAQVNDIEKLVTKINGMAIRGSE
jgi:hypothetical protein